MTERPTITREMVERVAQDYDVGGAGFRPIADAFMAGKRDGYEIAKYLDDKCGWAMDAACVELLDGFAAAVDRAYRNACMRWARDNNIQLPLPIGTEIAEGVIVDVYQHDGATYRVREPGAPEGRFLLVRFEDAREVKHG